MKRLYRVSEGRIIGGVCSGLSEYFNLDVTLIRLLFVALAFIEGFGILLYIICWIVIPLKDKKEENIIDEENIKMKDEKRKITNFVLGLIFIFIGTLILLSYYLEISKFVKFWPIILILIGIIIIIRSKDENR